LLSTATTAAKECIIGYGKRKNIAKYAKVAQQNARKETTEERK
jgi:hypothetical protein